MPSLIFVVALLAAGPPAAVAPPPAGELVTVVMPPEVAAEIRKAKLKERHQAELKQTIERRRGRAFNSAMRRRSPTSGLGFGAPRTSDKDDGTCSNCGRKPCKGLEGCSK